MKILFLLQAPQARGAEIFAAHLAESLQGKGHQAWLMTLLPGRFDLPFSGEQIHLNRSSRNRIWDRKAWKDLADFIKQHQPDVIQSMGGDTLKFMVFSSLAFGWDNKKVFYNGSLVSRYFTSKPVEWLNGLMYKKLHGIVAVSDASKSDLESVHQFKGIHQVIPVGVMSAKHTLSKGLFFDSITHIGGFTFEKNHIGLIRIYKLILEKCPTIQLTLVGDGPLRPEIESLIKSEGLENSVAFLGSLAAPFQSIPSNSILLLPSIIEGLPAVILEAFLAEIPVVAYNVGGVGEIIKNNETGFLIELGAEQKFASQVIDLLERSREEQDPMLQRAKKLADEKYGMEVVTEQYVDFYENLCE